MKRMTAVLVFSFLHLLSQSNLQAGAQLSSAENPPTVRKQGKVVLLDTPPCDPQTGGAAGQFLTRVSKVKYDVHKIRSKLLPSLLDKGLDISVQAIKPAIEPVFPEKAPPLPIIELPVSLDPPDPVAPAFSKPDPKWNEVSEFIRQGKLKEAVELGENLYLAPVSSFSWTRDKQARDILVIAFLSYAEALERNKQMKESLFYARSAVYIDPANIRASARLDSCLGKCGINARDIAARTELAQAARENRDYQTAIVEYLAATAIDDKPEYHLAIAECYLDGGQVLPGYDHLARALRLPNWEKGQTERPAYCHKRAADILFEYALKARDSGRGTKGMKRLRNAWTEYCHAFCLSPEDRVIRKQLLEISKLAIGIRANANNYLTLASANVLCGNKAEALACLQKAESLDPNIAGLTKVRTAADNLEVESQL